MTDRTTRWPWLVLATVPVLAAVVVWLVLGRLDRPEAVPRRDEVPGMKAARSETVYGSPRADAEPEAEVLDAGAPPPDGESTRRLPPVRLEAWVVDGETGRPVPGARVFLRSATSIPPLTCPREDSVHVVPMRVEAGSSLDVELGVFAPAGFAAEERTVRLRGPVSGLARTVRATLVLRPEVTVVVRVREEDRRPVAGARVVQLRAGDESIRVEDGVTASDGEVRLGGVPYLWRSRISVTVEEGGRRRLGSARIDRDARLVLIEVTFPRPRPAGANAASSAEIGLGGGVGGGRFGRRGSRGSLPPPPRTRLETVVRRRDGSPAVHARVLLEGVTGGWQRTVRTDGEGRVVAEFFPPGPVRITLEESGLLRVSTEVDVAEGVTVRSTLTEPEGLPLEILVRDREGMRVPFAHVSVRAGGRPYVLLEGEVQTLTLRTDAQGRLLLPALPPGEVEVEAHYAGRSAKGRAPAGGFLELRIP